MELEQLQQAWHELDTRLDALSAQLQARTEHERLGVARRALRGAGWYLRLEAAVWLGFIVTAAQFWVAHRHVMHLLVAGVALQVYGIVALIACVAQLSMLAGVHADAPVLVTQQRLATFMRFRALARLALGLPWWWLWLVCALVGTQWLAGLDLYARAPSWFAWNMGIGAAGMLASVWLARRLARHPPASPLLRQMIEDMSGRSLHRAQREIGALARFGGGG